MVAASIKIGPPDQLLIYAKKSRWKLSKNNPRLFFFILFIHNDVGVKRYFDPFDTELLRALHSRNSKNIRNPLIFLQKMASYSCF